MTKGLGMNLPARLTALLLLSIALLTSTNALSENYLQTPAFLQFLDKMEKEHGFTRFELVELFSDVKRQDGILESISRPAERTKTWAEYRPIFVTPKGISRGVNFYNKHRDTLLRAEQAYCVPAEVIVAIIGVETRYGVHRGKHRVIDALATLAFDYPRRSKFFSSELEQFLLLSKEAGLDPKVVKGSYAGAMGYPQFISSSYRAYAVDFDKDGKTDLIDNPQDAIGSVANYFKKHDWKTGQPVIATAQFNPAKQGSREALSKVINLGLTPKFTLDEITRAGLQPDIDLDKKQKATAWLVEGPNGEEYWIGLHNFYVITRYNRSHMYAMAVHQLSQGIGEAIKAQPAL